MYKHLIRPLLFKLSADYTHEKTIQFASLMNKYSGLHRILKGVYAFSDESLEQKIWGLNFPNPIGLAAGFDKNGTASSFMSSFGFGFIEVGSITAKASTGNPNPRTFRLQADESLINRMGLNNDGAETIRRRIANHTLQIPVSVNIAKTHNPDITGLEALKDYKFSFEAVKAHADFITLNISCPNTSEGKTFESPEALEQLLNYLQIGKDSLNPPVLVKFSVDIDKSLLFELLHVCENHAISGFVACNTSGKRENLNTDTASLEKIGEGGLSGKAISDKSTKIINDIYTFTKGEKTIIGVGGIFSAEDAIEKLCAGADLLQLYSSLVYEGPAVVGKINRQIARHLKENNLNHLYQLRRPKIQKES